MFLEKKGVYLSACRKKDLAEIPSIPFEVNRGWRYSLDGLNLKSRRILVAIRGPAVASDYRLRLKGLGLSDACSHFIAVVPKFCSRLHRLHLQTSNSA